MRIQMTLLVFWADSLVTAHTAGGYIHILIVLAVVVVINIIRRRRVKA